MQVFILILFLLYITIINRIEHFQDNLDYRRYIEDISRCGTMTCLVKMEDKCLNWCLNNMEKEKGYCQYRGCLIC